MQKGEKILAGQLSGDFYLTQDKNKKLAFIAGGIGVTPFRSIVRYMIDLGDRRDAVLFYAVKSEDEIAYRYLWIEAEAKVGLRTEYIVGKFINEDLIADKLPDFKERTFYISGPEAMVNAYKKLSRKMGVARTQIITDYFPGFA
jgi:ferredoxin-NADP reductase